MTTPPASPRQRALEQGARELALADSLARRRSLLAAALDELAADAAGLAQAAELLLEALRGGRHVFAAGNGGSAAEAQHFAAELVGRFKKDRHPFSVSSLSTDSSVLTAIANDYGYEQVFARQLEAHGKRGDLLVAFSTSGESQNVVQAAHVAHRLGLAVVGVTGAAESSLARAADVALRMPLVDTDTIQELHMMVTHLLCSIVESELIEPPGMSP